MSSINWFKKINAVLATINTGEFNPVQDRQTYAVMRSAIRSLMIGKPVEEPLLGKVIQNVAIRAGLSGEVPENIEFNKNQRAYAARNGWASFPTFVERYGNISTPSPVTFDLDGFSDADRNVVACFLANADAEQRANLVAWINRRNEVVPEPVAEPAKQVHRKRDAVTIWVKESKGTVKASGNIEVGGQKFSLNFMDFYSALDRIPESESTRSWRAVMAGEIAEAILPVERNAEGIAARSTMSGLFAANDSFGMGNAVTESVAVLLEWEGSKPVRAVMCDEVGRTVIDIKQEANDRFKGFVEFAA